MIKKIITECLEGDFVVKITDVFLFGILIYRCEENTSDIKRVNSFKRTQRNKVGYETEDKDKENKQEPAVA